MRLVQRYLFAQLSRPVLGALAALTAIALLSQSLSALDVIVERGQSPFTLLRITLLALPQLISLVLPIGLFVGLLIGLNRLQTENEVVVCFAGGMSRWQVIAPAFRLAALTALLALVVNLWIQPLAYRALRHEYYRVRTDFASTLVREGEFVQAGPGLTVYVQSVDQHGLLRRPFIYVDKGDKATAYAADEGRIVTRQGKPVLILRRGSSEAFSRQGVLNYLSFDQYAFELSPYVRNDELFRYKTSDRWLRELLFPNLDLVWEHNNKKRLYSEGHARLASPLFAFTFTALALAGVLGGPLNRLGYGRRIAWAAAAALLARIGGFAAQSLGAGSPWLNLLQYVVPAVPFILAMRVLFRQKVARPVQLKADMAAPTSTAVA